MDPIAMAWPAGDWGKRIEEVEDLIIEDGPLEEIRTALEAKVRADWREHISNTDIPPELAARLDSYASQSGWKRSRLP